MPLTWTTYGMPPTLLDAEWSDTAWSPELGIFAAVSAAGDTNCIATSPDGTLWTPRTSPKDSLNSVVWSPTYQYFVAVGSNLPQSAVISDDGITWVDSPLPRGIDDPSNYRKVVWSSALSMFVACAANGVNGRIATSLNGYFWQIRATPEGSWWGLDWSPELGVFVAVGGTFGFKVMTSSNGTAWVAQATPVDNDWFDVAWSPSLGLFAAVAVSGTGDRIMTSPDGINWTVRASPADEAWRRIIWVGWAGLFIAVSSSGVNTVMTSSDGISWELMASSSLLYGLAASTDRVVAVGNEALVGLEAAPASFWQNFFGQYEA